MAGSEFLFPIAGRKVTGETSVDTLIKSIKTPDGMSEVEAQFIRDDVRRYYEESFKGKRPSTDNESNYVARAHGAPGAGKSELLHAIFENLSQSEVDSTVYSSADEYGALEYIRQFLNEIALIEFNYGRDRQMNHPQRLKARDNVRDATGVGHDLVVNKAIRDGYNLFIDTTSSSLNGTLASMKLVRKAEKKNVIYSVYAPYEISKERCIARTRTISLNDELVGKRIAAYGTFKPLMDAIIREKGDFTLFYNPNNESEPQPVFEIEDGTLVAVNEDLLKLVGANVKNEMNSCDELSSEAFKDAVNQYCSGLEMIERMSRQFKSQPGPTTPGL